MNPAIPPRYNQALTRCPPNKRQPGDNCKLAAWPKPLHSNGECLCVNTSFTQVNPPERTVARDASTSAGSGFRRSVHGTASGECVGCLSPCAPAAWSMQKTALCNYVVWFESSRSLSGFASEPGETPCREGLNYLCLRRRREFAQCRGPSACRSAVTESSGVSPLPGLP